MKNSVRCPWKVLSLDEALSSLEEGLLPQPSLDDSVCILLKCRQARLPAHAARLYAYLRTSGLERDKVVGNHLVPMLVDVGRIEDAHQVFDSLDCRNEWSWESLINGYIKSGKPHLALTLFRKKDKEDSTSLNGRILVALLRASTEIQDLESGLQIHAEISRLSLLDRDASVGSVLVNLYAKCGSLTRAQQVFDELHNQDVVAWTTLITGYGEHGHSEHAIHCFDQMQLKGISPNSVTFVCILKACGNIGAVEKICGIHVEIENQGLLQHELVGNTLVDMYARCGSLTSAAQVFSKILVRDVVSWNSLITGYVEHEHGEEALRCFDAMQLEGISPNAITFVCSLKACSIIAAMEKGEEIHNEVERCRLLERNQFVGSALIDMYVKFGLLAKAQQVFDKLKIRDVVSWTALLAGYAEHGQDQEALECLKQMQLEGIRPNAVTLVSSLKACASLRTLDRGQDVHTEIERRGMLQGDLIVGNSLVDMYAKCGRFVLAREVFDELPARDIVSWNALIGGYTEHRFAAEALVCYEQMQVEGVCPDALTLVCCLKASGSIRAAEKGGEIYLEAKRQGLLGTEIVGNALIDMYAKCGLLDKAQQVFDKLPNRDVVAWTALIAGYTELGDGARALQCYDKMQQDGVNPNAVTLLCSLKACGNIGSLNKGIDVYSQIESQGLLETDLAVGNTLVDVHAKCGSITLSQMVFDKLPIRSVVSWNALIAAYAEYGYVEEAFVCFEQMELQGFLPNLVTYLCILKACSSIGAIDRGGYVHAEIERQGLVEGALIGNTLVNMYAKCGSFGKAMQVFDQLAVRDVVSWTALMAGHADIGQNESVFYMFDRMLGEGVEPNSITFVVVLNACTRSGLCDKSQTYFEAMSRVYGVCANPEHHACVVDVLGRTGQLEMAEAMSRKMPFVPNPIVWHAVLDSCKKWGSPQYGKLAFEQAIDLDDNDSVAYIHMSQIFADIEMEERVSAVAAALPG